MYFCDGSKLASELPQGDSPTCLLPQYLLASFWLMHGNETAHGKHVTQMCGFGITSQIRLIPRPDGEDETQVALHASPCTNAFERFFDYCEVFTLSVDASIIFDAHWTKRETFNPST